MSTTSDRSTWPTSVTVKPLLPWFGAEIMGVDLSAPLEDVTIKAIHDSWIRQGILLFRGANNDDDAQMRLSAIFGTMEPSATADMNDPNNRYLLTLSYDPEVTDKGFSQHYRVGGIERAGWLGWHWDQAFMPTIVRGAVLRMDQPAREMGETGFIDAIAAYDRLSETMKARIEGLEIVYEFNPDFASGQYGFPEDIEALPRRAGAQQATYDFPPVVHPLVITQRETGRKVLKLSPMHARYVLGLDQTEGDALLKEIAKHLVDPQFAYFHKWQRNDMIVWDNWRVIHSANGVPLDCARVARRTTISGDYEAGRYLDPKLDSKRKVARLID